MNNIVRYLLIAVPIIIVGYLLWYFSHIVTYILISYVLSLIGNPIVDLTGRIKIKGHYIPKSIRALLSLAVLWFVFIMLIRFFVPLITMQADILSSLDYAQLIQSYQEPMEKLNHLMIKYHLAENDFSLANYISSKAIEFISPLKFQSFIGVVFNFIGNFVIAVFSITFITFFFLKDDKLFADSIILVFKEEYEERVKSILASVKRLLVRYFVGIFFQIIGIIILNSVGLLIVGINFKLAVVIALMTGILNVVPYIGPLLGTVLGVLIGFLANTSLGFSNELLWFIVSMLIVFSITQLVDNFIFQPLIFSNSVLAHPLEIFLIILVAASLGGMMGMLLAIPGYTIVRVVAKEFFSKFKVVRKLTENI